jgi:hypothetical protein
MTAGLDDETKVSGPMLQVCQKNHPPLVTSLCFRLTIALSNIIRPLKKLKTMKAIALGVTGIALLMATGCKKENTATGISYQVKTANRTSTVARVLAGTVQWNSGYAWAREIEFEAKNRGNNSGSGNNNSEIEFKTESRQKIDLFAPVSALGTIQVPQGTYDEIKFEVEVSPNNGEAAFLLNGSYSNNGTSTPVTFRIDLPVEIETEKDNFTISNSASYTAVTTFDLSLLKQGITAAMLDAATKTNGTIIISSTSNTNLYDIVFDRLRNCGGIEIED